MKAIRFSNNPIIHPDMDERIGTNINGPSLIRMPEWVENSMGKYYLYFAHHQGTYIRLAYADHLEGPWTVYAPGVFDLRDSHFSKHIASPDIRIFEERREIWMYYHGCCLPGISRQGTRLAISADGLHFQAREDVLGHPYWRTFEWGRWHYAFSMPGKFYRSVDGLSNWESGPQIFSGTRICTVEGQQTRCGMRHGAVYLKGSELRIFYSNRGDNPERILMVTLQLSDDWHDWQRSEPIEILAPEMAYEGVNELHVPSRGGAIHEPVWQLRDPAIFEEEGRTYLLYSVAGERGIAIAELEEV